ncbi:MAG: dihydroneopterin aldolase [Bacteroidetes bacterium]|nr:MAG: dihydroneopterin aldolase [Bacteroidota bacterium]
MAIIALEGMRFFARHGFYEEEQIIGNEFVVDVYITTRTTEAAVSDNLYETINYETVYTICQLVMKRPARLLETVAERIGLGIRHQFQGISQLKVRVRKNNPPLGGPVEAAWVEIDGKYEKRCGKCGKPMLCYRDTTCWCMDSRVPARTREHLRARFDNSCLCSDCLKLYEQ